MVVAVITLNLGPQPVAEAPTHRGKASEPGAELEIAAGVPEQRRIGRPKRGGRNTAALYVLLLHQVHTDARPDVEPGDWHLRTRHNRRRQNCGRQERTPKLHLLSPRSCRRQRRLRSADSMIVACFRRDHRGEIPANAIGARTVSG